MPVSPPAFSVVVPAYNSEGTIDQTMASILAQTRPELELVVVDDGSTDGTPDRIAMWAERDSRVRPIAQENGGTAAARNRGIAAARAPLVSFLDDDDLWMPDYLEQMAGALDRFPTAGFAYADAWLLDDGKGRIRRRTSFEHYPDLPDLIEADDLLPRLIGINFVLSSTTCRASVLADVGGFEARVSGTDDWDLWMRIATYGYGATRSRTPVLIQRDRPGSQSKDLLMMFGRSIVTLQRLLDYADLNASNRRAAEARIAELQGRISSIERGTPIDRLRRLRRGAIGARDRYLPDRDWLPEPPPPVAVAFPELARGYGRPLSSVS